MMTATQERQVSWMDLARAKVYRLCGPEDGEVLLRESLLALELDALRSADDLLLVAERLVGLGGFKQAVGHALQFQATLHGAKSLRRR